MKTNTETTYGDQSRKDSFRKGKVKNSKGMSAMFQKPDTSIKRPKDTGDDNDGDEF